ncbi:hypothetical protein MCOR29_007084 [Pyricularia oryzae]|nr:hypothetical protein MCOR01_003564 [Pyricularia oryzae]KAI6273362.1 hypothetical protein MCOR26_006955 [Pyricularia oryzae]KAI6309655.1 hypothetical protein MCOR34_006733 [Pyricularia oryzae]KAI6315214.1 hypothetical protein MCOR29_007084 [Pyricularia oryzae]KAI6322935.1 hypothetical protein MCOR30_007456 [Pyricularia oryzae]
MATTEENTALPATMKAVVLTGVNQPLELRTVPVPQVTPGSVIVKIICTSNDRGIQEAALGHARFTFPRPMIPTARAVGRVAQIGPDTTSLAPGQLVLVEPHVRARDDPDVQILWGMWDGPSAQSKKFARDNWTDACMAEYVRAPLENVYALDEAKLCGRLGHAPEDLVHLATLAILHGGLAAVGLRAGETVLVAPATGYFSGAAVPVALAMGAGAVVAVGRNAAALERLQATFGAERVRTVVTTGDVEADAAAMRKAAGPVDVYMDVSPPAASGSSHMRSGFKALGVGARAVLMGFVPDDIPLSYTEAMFKNLTVKGKYMYEREDMRGLIKMAESGVLKLGRAAGVEIIGRHKLEEYETMLHATSNNGDGSKLILTMILFTIKA